METISLEYPVLVWSSYPHQSISSLKRGGRALKDIANEMSFKEQQIWFIQATTNLFLNIISQLTIDLFGCIFWS